MQGSPDDSTGRDVSGRRVAGGVLAGGASRRMGGMPKALLAWPPGTSGRTFLDTVLLQMRDAGISPLAVVTGTHHAPIAAASTAWPEVSILFNPRHDEGQVTSLWRLLDWAETLPDTPDWLAVTLVDLPGVQADTVCRLRTAALASAPGTLVVRPAVRERHGHPVLWHRDAWPRLRAASVQSGARLIVHGLVEDGRVLDVQVDDEGVLRDIDTAADYTAGTGLSARE